MPEVQHVSDDMMTTVRKLSSAQVSELVDGQSARASAPPPVEPANGEPSPRGATRWPEATQHPQG